MVNENIKILIIDDERLNCLVLQGMLEPEGYQIIMAENGSDGREIAISEVPDLILLDIMMPGEDGFETCKKLKHGAVTSDIPIIFISALDDTESKVEGLTIGGWDYITKPFQKEEVVARVKNYLKLSLYFKQVIHEQAQRLQQIHMAQQAILVKPEEIPNLKFGVYYNAKLEAGGDFYDVFPVSKYSHDFFISDISGHDLGASFATSALKALVRQNASMVYTPAETMKTINNVLTSIFQGGQHLTAVYLRLNQNKKRATIVNAAHCSVIIARHTGETEKIGATGTVIGSFENSIFESEVIDIFPKDRIFLYTDGLVESFEAGNFGRDTGQERLITAIQQYQDEPIRIAVSKIAEEMLSFSEKAEDDIVLLGLEV